MMNLAEIDYLLTGRRVDLWLVQVPLDCSLLPAFESLLGPEEAVRARAFRFEHLRQNYTIVHGILRMLLGRYLDRDPSTLQLSAGPNGKPHIQRPGHVQFNLSHSDNIALFGFTAGCDIGVDVERIRPMDDLADDATHFFCPEEARDLMSLPTSERPHAFFRCWTRKEAYLKAVGAGLQTPLDSFRVSLRPLEPARLLHVNGSREAAERWTLHSVDLPSCIAALAYPAPPREVRLLSPLSPASLIQEYVAK